ncbi:MAG TPA: hypothetical protein VHC44_03610, partial [Verrucomicrobiae bacterium]|nr:hypothetical protein [Verrucomicrobiae bacterium]
MLHELNARARASVLLFCLLFAVAMAGSASAQEIPPISTTNAPAPVTNLWDLSQAVNRQERQVCDVKLEGVVCAATDPATGVIILRDDSGVALIELGNDQPEMSPGDKIRIEGQNCLLRRRDMGVKICSAPVVDNDGVHGAVTNYGEITLTAGRHPVRLEWFNQLRDFSLQVAWQPPNAPSQPIPASVFSHRLAPDPSGRSLFAPGLRADAYEGNWQTLPDFELLKPVKSGVVTDFDLSFRTRDPLVALQFNGFIDVPSDGRYVFSTSSDDGSMLFIGATTIKITKLESIGVPPPTPAIIGESMTNNTGQRWESVEGRVNFVSPFGNGLELKLRSQGNSMRVRIADATGLDATKLMNSRVRITGAGFGIFNPDQRIVLGELFAATAKDLQVIDTVSGASSETVPLLSAREVQSLPLEDAKKN